MAIGEAERCPTCGTWFHKIKLGHQYITIIETPEMPENTIGFSFEDGRYQEIKFKPETD